jgi:hypothetical protein
MELICFETYTKNPSRGSLFRLNRQMFENYNSEMSQLRRGHFFPMNMIRFITPSRIVYYHNDNTYCTVVKTKVEQELLITDFVGNVMIIINKNE